jgi:large subunit ribosomal protein L2
MKRSGRNFLDKYKKSNIMFKSGDKPAFRRSEESGDKPSGDKPAFERSGEGRPSRPRRFGERRGFGTPRFGGDRSSGFGGRSGGFGSRGPSRFGGERRPFTPRAEGEGAAPAEGEARSEGRSFAPRSGGFSRGPSRFGSRSGGFSRGPSRFGGERRPFTPRAEGEGAAPAEGEARSEGRSFAPRSGGFSRGPSRFGGRSGGFGSRGPSRFGSENREPRRFRDAETSDRPARSGDFKTKKVNMVNTSTRFTVRVDKTGLWKGDPYDKLTKSLPKTGGRNNKGRITCRHMGGGHKKKYRMVDFRRNTMDGINATVVRLEYDPNRTCFIALIKYENGIFDYILAPHGLKEGMVVCAGENVNISIGNALPLKNIPDGTLVHNIELKPGAGGVLARSAGASVSVCGRETDAVIVAMPSGFKKTIPNECRATVGELSNKENMNIVLGKAGANRHLGIRPENRGVALNPVDHPHGGRGRPKVRTNHTGRVKHGQKTVRVKNHF